MSCNREISYANLRITTHSYEYRAAHPANPPVDSGVEPEHKSNVFAKSSDPIEPADCNHFTHNDEENREGDSIFVKERYNVASTLKNAYYLLTTT